MTTAPAEVVEGFVKAWERNDPDEIIGYFADDCAWYDGVPSEPHRGRDAIMAMLQRYSRHITDVHIDVDYTADAKSCLGTGAFDEGTGGDT